MPAPSYKGRLSTTGWAQTAGVVNGTDPEGRNWIEVPFSGPGGLPAEVWRSSHGLGDSCPVPGFGALLLEALPTVRDGGRGISYATLRFSSPFIETGGEEGSEPRILKTIERKSAGIITSEGIKPIYSYDAPVVYASYIRASDTTTTRFDSEIDKNDFDRASISNDSGGGPKGSDLPEDASGGYKRDTLHSVMEREETGGIWRITEYHRVIIESFDE